MALPNVTSNSPSAGYISWTACSLAYGGNSYPIPAGSTNKRFTYWDKSASTPGTVQSNGTLTGGSSTLVYVDVLPGQSGDGSSVWDPEDNLLFLNKNGIGLTAEKTAVVDGSLLVSGSILADAIGANQVTAGKIDAGVVTAREILGDTITGDKIKANQIVASHIVNGSIGTSQLSVGSFGSNMVPNSFFEDWPSASTLPDGWALVNSTGYTGATVSRETSLVITGATSLGLTPGAGNQAALTTSALLPARAGEDIAFQAYYAGTQTTGVVSGGVALGVFYFDAAMAQVDFQQTSGDVTGNNTIDYISHISAAPATAKWMKPVLIVGTGMAKVVWDELMMQQRVTSVMIKDGAIDGKVITGATVQTASGNTNAVRLDANGFRAYGASGQVFGVDTTGNLTLAGTISSTGAITGGTFQTATGNTSAIRMSNTVGLEAWNSLGTRVFQITNTGSMTLAGTLTSTGTISGGTVTGATVQTASGNISAIRMSTTNGLQAYNSGGTQVFQITNAGAMTLTGTLTVSGAGTISGGTVTGSTVQTGAGNTSVIRLNNTNGLIAYNASGTNVFQITPTGSMTLAGTLTSSGTITGGTFQTAASGERVIVRNDGSGGIIEVYSGVSGETPGYINPELWSTSYPQMTIQSGTTASATYAATLKLSSSGVNQATATLSSQIVSLSGAFSSGIYGGSKVTITSEGDGSTNGITIDSTGNTGSNTGGVKIRGGAGGVSFTGDLSMAPMTTFTTQGLTVNDTFTANVPLDLTNHSINNVYSVFANGKVYSDSIAPNVSSAVVFQPNNGVVKVSGGTNIGGRVGQDPGTPGNGTALTFTGSFVAATTDNMNSGSTSSSNTMPFYAKTINGYGAYVNASDEREKNTIKDVAPGKAVDLIKKVRVRSFKMNDIDPERTQYGVIAQEMKNVLPSAITEIGDRLGMSYQDLWALNLAVTQQLIKRIEALEAH